MRRRIASYSVVVTLCTLLLLSAVVLAADACTWGMPAYVMVGGIMLVVMLLVPYVARRAFHRANRLPAALGFALLGLMVWLIGWFFVFARSTC